MKPKLPEKYFYKAPELLNKSGFYNPFLADVFSLGLVALAGVGVQESTLDSFVHRQTDIEIIMDQFKTKFNNTNNTNNDLQKKIENLLRRMLVMEPSRRETFSDLNDEINHMDAQITNINYGEITAITDQILLFEESDKWKLLKTQGDSYSAMGLFDKSFNYYSDALKVIYF